ncbi:SPASM domain-containing protein [Candidatus Poribacteria bacterium]|nr:SPASM domain-containing protein [Candidatus Poribacteria bacterium]
MSEKQCFIDPSCDIRGGNKMLFGNNVTIQKDCWLNIAFNNPNSQYIIEIGEGTNIGRRCTISAANKIKIGGNVLIGPNVFIADTSHEYRHIAIPIIKQGITTATDEIYIGNGSWIGANSVIVGNVKIGRHCIIGANTVINKDIPDYCVAVGNPFKIVKMFDIETGTWVKINDKHEVEKYLSKRDNDLLNYLVPITALISLQIEVSSSCNLQCPQCFQYIEGHKKGFFSRELWDKKIKPILGQIRDIHLVGIGEPLLCKDFFYFADDARKHNIFIHTTSNMQLLNEEITEKIVLSGIHELNFSCDGVSKEVYEKIRVNGKIEILKNSLALINKFKLKHNSKFPKLTLNFGSMKSNIHELPHIVEFAKTFGVDSITAYHNIMYIPELKDESLYHYQELSDQKFSEAKSIANQLGIEMFIPGLFSKPLQYSYDKIYCGNPNGNIYVYSDGRVGPCCMDFPDRYVLGDIQESSIEEIWNSTPILKLRRELATTPSETCKYCASHGKMNITDPKYFFKFKDSKEYIKTLG